MVRVAVNHAVAVAAEADEVGFGVDFHFAIDFMQWLDVMDFDEVFALFAIEFLKVKATGHTFCTVDFYGGESVFRAAFVFCRIDVGLAAFADGFAVGLFF